MDVNGLVLEITKNLSVIALAVYLITQCKPFRRAMNQSSYSYKDKWALLVVFGMLSAVGNYLNVPFQQDGMVHTRLVGTIIGGLFGGPLVGVGASIIGMIPRYFISVSAIPIIVVAGIANIIIGIVAGYINKRYGARQISLKIACLVGLLSEVILRIGVLWQAQSVDVFCVEKTIALPAGMATCLGVMLAVYIIRGVYQDEDIHKAKAAKKVIDIIFCTRGVFRQQGFTQEAAYHIAKTMYDILTVDYVAISSPQGIWAACMQSKDKKNSPNTISLPLILADKKIAEIYVSRPGLRSFRSYEKQWLLRFAELLSLELYQMELDRKAVLLSQAEVAVLKSQIRPHFIFNMLSTIKAIVSTEPEQAKDLICDLSSFLRNRLHHASDTIFLKDELEAVETYIRLEKMRYGERLQVIQHIQVETWMQRVPCFVLQMLVENAIKHGIFKKKYGGTIQICAMRKQDQLILSVQDDGMGMDQAILQQVNHLSIDHDIEMKSESTGIGLKNIYDRMHQLYGERGKFLVENLKEGGTCVSIIIPWG
ncbi:LytS/YhcK type 5TM receptor domain-containing protein [uncultured Megasphaera sp.]|uniref:LytS/YhcK type 5TM receptor domain-containing protein n=1 Tax=uncultured Megasphaera sp. TaxID=165188 RepID=UPI0025924839|nr:LytS/YhcK type 5TM receptor domain-containing protein [uncultured Megasphaera sp.]